VEIQPLKLSYWNIQAASEGNNGLAQWGVIDKPIISYAQKKVWEFDIRNRICYFISIKIDSKKNNYLIYITDYDMRVYNNELNYYL
jgi:hypothetical protein